MQALVEESVAKLECVRSTFHMWTLTELWWALGRAIAERRNVLLREMHQMIRRKNDLGSVLNLDDEDEYGLEAFLERFKLSRDKYANKSIALFDLLFMPYKAQKQAALLFSVITSSLPLHFVKIVMSPPGPHHLEESLYRAEAHVVARG